ncbi:DUF2079 domain-containing protein [Streptomyces yangpuensis]|uniref:DUF2079 domain-containing protein n=1 Tax=Streptomyces yangpuensis TaxID=1648182 RepID=A0ABY5PVY0_9ACTN|nr:DUF2079 domain-containing protein [Streptomyces yangpuensis]UUY48184.1 DUF2079 domain-containing protein [Streptomyces yangpuensis]
MTSDAIARPAAAAQAPSRAAAPRWAGPWAVAAGLFLVYLVLSVGRFRRMDWASWDLGIFEQAIRAYAHLQEPVADLKGPGANILGDHFSPIIALVAPVYRVFPGPVTLLVVQAALFALSAVPVTRAAGRLLGRARGIAVGVAYGLSWGIQRAVEFDFHEIAFAVPLLAFALEAVLARRWRAALLWGLPLILVKEDLGFTLAALAVVVAWRCRTTDRRTAWTALGIAAAACVFAVLVFTVFIPAFATDGYGYWHKIEGGGPFAGAGTKLATLGWVLIPTSGLLALRSPLLLVAAPTLGWRFLSGDDHYWSTDWHYSAVLMPVVALALVDAIDTVRRGDRPWLRSYALQLPTAVLAASLALAMTSMPTAKLTEAATYEKPDRVVAIEKLLDRIPDGATVEADTTPLTRLTSRCRVLWIGGSKGVVPDWITIDNGNKWAGEDPAVYAGQLHPGERYTVVGEAGGIVLMQRNTDR